VESTKNFTQEIHELNEYGADVTNWEIEKAQSLNVTSNESG
jgi:hypothetical protein